MFSKKNFRYKKRAKKAQKKRNPQKKDLKKTIENSRDIHPEEITILSEKLADPEEDAFDFKKQAEAAANTITKNPSPIVYAVCGKWGSGKSTFLKFIADHLLNDDKRILIYFNAWRASIHQDARIAFVYELEEQLLKNKVIRKLIYNKDDIKKVSKILFPLTVKYFFEKNRWTSFAMEAYKDAVKQHSLCTEGSIEAEKKVITEFLKISDKLNKKDYQIYIIIDELDRCAPTSAVDIIESIRLFFSGEDELSKKINKKESKNDQIPFKYIIAMDEDFMAKVFREKYYLSEKESYDYLSKFIQYRFHLTSNKWQKFIKDKVNIVKADSFFPNNDNDKNQCFKDIEEIFNYFNLIAPREARLVLSYLFTWQKQNKDKFNWIKNLTFKSEISDQEKQSIKNGLLIILNKYLALLACIKVLFPDEVYWFLKRNLLKKLPTADAFWDNVSRDTPLNSFLFLERNFQIIESDIKTEDKIRGNVEIISFALHMILRGCRTYLNDYIGRSKISDLKNNLSKLLDDVIL